MPSGNFAAGGQKETYKINRPRKTTSTARVDFKFCDKERIKQASNETVAKNFWKYLLSNSDRYIYIHIYIYILVFWVERIP